MICLLSTGEIVKIGLMPSLWLPKKTSCYFATSSEPDQVQEAAKSIQHSHATSRDAEHS